MPSKSIPDMFRILLSDMCISQSDIRKTSDSFFLVFKSLSAILAERNILDFCDHDKLYIQNPENPTPHEAAAILATHAGNTSVYSFAAEVEYHAKFLTPLAKIKIPFFGRSIYDSAIRADMTVDDKEFEGPAPFYQEDSKIVRQQYTLHREPKFGSKEGTLL